MYSPADQYVSMAEISFVWQILYYLRHINQQKEKEKTANRFRCAACETKLPLFLPAATLWFLFRFEFGYAWSVSIVRIHFCYCFFLSFTSLLLIFFAPSRHWLKCIAVRKKEYIEENEIRYTHSYIPIFLYIFHEKHSLEAKGKSDAKTHSKQKTQIIIKKLSGIEKTKRFLFHEFI